MSISLCRIYEIVTNCEYMTVLQAPESGAAAKFPRAGGRAAGCGEESP